MSFSKFDKEMNANNQKPTFHQLYNYVKENTKPENGNQIDDEDDKYEMNTFLKNRKESFNLKTLEKSEMVLNAVDDLLDKDAAFVENFDFMKVKRILGLERAS